MKQNIWTFGIDEVGRGSLAGPVYLSGVFVPSEFGFYTFVKDSQEYAKKLSLESFRLVRDSKKLKPEKREQVANLVSKYNFFNSTLSASNKLIDIYGIGVCLSHMMSILVTQASIFYKNSGIAGDFQIIVDGQLKLLDIYNQDLITELFGENQSLAIGFTDLLRLGRFGQSEIQNFQLYRENYADDIYLSVALASNLAKVKRDALMEKYSLTYPEFGWKNNKGYGTLFHRKAILNNSENPHLRQTFIQKVLLQR